VTTGCTCGTPGCGGVAPAPGGRCPQCETAAMAPGPARTVRQIIHTALNGPDLTTGDVTGGRQAARHAGS
jgi:hypothetical protein